MLQRLFPEKQPTKQLKQQNSQQIKLLKNNVKTKSVSGENSTNAKEIRNIYFTSEKTRNIKRYNRIKVYDKKKKIEVNDLLNGQYSANKNIGFKTPTIRSNL